MALHTLRGDKAKVYWDEQVNSLLEKDRKLAIETAGYVYRSDGATFAYAKYLSKKIVDKIGNPNEYSGSTILLHIVKPLRKILRATKEII